MDFGIMMNTSLKYHNQPPQKGICIRLKKKNKKIRIHNILFSEETRIWTNVQQNIGRLLVREMNMCSFFFSYLTTRKLHGSGSQCGILGSFYIKNYLLISTGFSRLINCAYGLQKCNQNESSD